MLIELTIIRNPFGVRLLAVNLWPISQEKSIESASVEISSRAEAVHLVIEPGSFIRFDVK